MHIFQAATMYSIFGSGSFVKQNKKPVNPEILSKQKLVNHNILSKPQMRQKDKTIFYTHKDHLGSYETITNDRGELVEKLSFDPWGRRRNADTWAYENTPIRYLFDRGFTQHEHLDAFGLVNMNGRVYDAWVGSFLSPDPILQAPANSQNYNRYSYALNNPLKYIDPSGYKMALPAIIDILWQSSHGGTWNQSSGISLFESDSDAQEFVEDNIESLLPSGDDGQVRNIVKVHDNNGNSYHYDKSTGQVWNSETVSFQYGTEFMSNQKVYYDDGTMADWFLQLKEVEIVEKKTKIKGQTGGGELADDGITMQEAGVGMTVFGISFTAKSNLYQALEGSKNAPKYFKFASKFGTRLSYLGLGMTAYDGLSNGWQNSHSADMLIQSTLITITAINPIVGGVAVGVYFVGDLGFQYFHDGQSMTQYYLDN